MLGVWEEYFKKLQNPEGECQIPHSVRRELEVRTITEEEVEKAVKTMKTGCRSERTVSGNGENKQTSGNQVADEAV